MSNFADGSTGATTSKSLKSVTITTSGTWVVPVGAEPIVEVDGSAGGAAGGGAFTLGGGGGGGGGGAACESVGMIVVPGETLTITIGPGGVAGVSGAVPTAGTKGGDTSIIGSIDSVFCINDGQSGGLPGTITNGGKGGDGCKVHANTTVPTGGAGGATGNGAAGASGGSSFFSEGLNSGGSAASGGAGVTGTNSSISGGLLYAIYGVLAGVTAFLGIGGIPGGGRWGKREAAYRRFLGPLPYPWQLAGDRVANYGYGMGGEGASASDPTPTAGAGLPGFIRIWYRE